MSILFGNDSRKIQVPKKNPYGRRLDCTVFLNINGAYDITLNDTGTIAYIAAAGELVIINMTDPLNPEITGRLGGIGTGRQIEVQNGIAYMTARADGLYIIDVSNAQAPHLASHYDTVELATGVFINGDYCAVTCRHLGVEIINVKDINHPVHICNVLAGEAQSVFIDGNYMYVGCWVQREIMIFDISNPYTPVHCSTCELDGYGDGIFIKENLLYAATGHHSRRLYNRRAYQFYEFTTNEMFSDGYGCGHGIEIFDISNKSKPVFLSRLKTPSFFMSSNDMWDVIVSGFYAYMADSYSGLFVFDIRKPCSPLYETYSRLPIHPVHNLMPQPPIQQHCCPVNGIAVGQGFLYAVSNCTGLHVFKIDNARPVIPPIKYNPTNIKPIEFKNGSKMLECAFPGKNHGEIEFYMDSQVHGVIFFNGYAVIAAGGEGLYVLNPNNNYSIQSHCRTKGFAMDIKLHKDHIYVVEGKGGLSVWKLQNANLVRIGEFITGPAARQIVIYHELDIAAIQLGNGGVQFIDITKPSKPQDLKKVMDTGMMYYKNIIDCLYKGRYAIIAPLGPKTIFFDLIDKNDIKFSYGEIRDLCPIEDGIIVYRNRLFTVSCGKIRYEDYNGEIYIDSIELKGWPRIINDDSYLINRCDGIISHYDIQNMENIRFIKQIDTKGHPEDIIYHEGRLWIPCGHRGLLSVKK